MKINETLFWTSEVVYRCNCLKSVVISDHTKQYCRNIAFSFTWPASMLIYWNKRKFLHKKRIQLPQDCLGTPIWPPFHCFGTPIWPP